MIFSIINTFKWYGSVVDQDKRATLTVMEFLGVVEKPGIVEYLSVVEYLSAPGLTQLWHSGSRRLLLS